MVDDKVKWTKRDSRLPPGCKCDWDRDWAWSHPDPDVEEHEVCDQFVDDPEFAPYCGRVLVFAEPYDDYDEICGHRKECHGNG